MKQLKGGLENIPGFTFSAVQCGIRYSDRLDYALIVSDKPCVASGVFTTNRISAAPVKLCINRIGRPISAILVNATNANACTGDRGYRNAEDLTADIAAKLHVKQDSVLMASTGIIGHQLPLEKMMKAHDSLVAGLSSENGILIPRAIMTTDTVPKAVSVSFATGKGEFSIGGTAKGSGMIAPNMATLLAFILTDATVQRDTLKTIFKRAIDTTLNAITIDGDMSTNDTAIILSPESGPSLEDARDLESFEEALTHVLQCLGEMLISDGEGTTKTVTVSVKNARNDADAAKIARSIAQSLLVKTALYGNDPNWGRIAAAAGYSGGEIEESRLSISFDNTPLMKMGTPVPFDKAEITSIMSRDKFTITVDIGLGSANASMLTSDISSEYVMINSAYST